MLLAHKIELRPTKQQADYLDRACGSRRHAFKLQLDPKPYAKVELDTIRRASMLTAQISLHNYRLC